MGPPRGFRGVRRAAAAIAAVLPPWFAGAAAAQADLVVLAAESEIRFVGCEEDAPLAVGRIVVLNVGDADARLRLGDLDRFPRSMLAVYDPLRLDLIDDGFQQATLAAGDRVEVRVEIGRGAVKRGRFGADADDGRALDLSALTREDRREVQRALDDLGFYDGAIDGLFGDGVEAAVRSLQRDMGAVETGRLTVGQARALAALAERSLNVAEPPSGPVLGVVAVTLLAVVDPYNRVDEADETNNVARFSGEIDCG